MNKIKGRIKGITLVCGGMGQEKAILVSWKPIR